ncbi:hypothetical protein [Cryobacterium sp. PH31-L1]|uniref:hypothetical protein n=1 Tax=Cryobacterium sp. PH31-L1 TaxID=3046199 RepID=UPI0024BBBAEC|nr:hypothetical protein [Cryobacterium sp. PH31-L1]MDJ0378208.1 hypothetical protein [Cryobacterium sp. PH31-L1]
MSADSDNSEMVTGIIAFSGDDRPVGAVTVTVLVEDVSRADAPSTVVGSVTFDSPAAPASGATELPFTVTVPRPVLNGVRALNVRVHVREMNSKTEVRQTRDSRESLAHSTARVSSRTAPAPDQSGRPGTGRPDITEGDFVSTQSHPVLSDPVLPGLALVRVPVLRV